MNTRFTQTYFACLRTLLSIYVIARLLGPVRASAEQAAYFGVNPRSMGLAGAYAAVADDLGALYYNPAGLVQLQGTKLAVGTLWGWPMLKEDGAKVPAPNESSYYVHVGLPLGGWLKDQLALAVSLNIPTGKLLSADLHKKHESSFPLYEGSTQLLQFRAGLGGRIPWRPLSFLALGAAVQVLGSVVGDIGFYAPFQRTGPDGPADPDSRLEAWANMNVPTSVFYTAGAIAFPAEHWRIGLVYHSAQYISVDFPLSLRTRLAVSEDYRPIIPIEAVARFSTKYQPQQVTVGLSHDRGRWLLSADLTWIDYSSYRIPYPTLDIDLEQLKRDPDLRLLFGQNSVLLDPMKPQTSWHDVLMPRIGVEYRLRPWVTLRGGYFYEHSPLVSTNIPILDCDKHSLVLGTRLSALRPWNLLPGWIHFDVSVQELIFAGRSVLASDIGGHVFAFSAGLEASFQ